MQQSETLTPYEVYCHNCRVTFAAETKQCIHCGGRLGKRGGALTFDRSSMRRTEQPSGAPEILIEDGDVDETPRMRFSPMTLLWIVLIAGTFAQRACQGG